MYGKEGVTPMSFLEKVHWSYALIFHMYFIYVCMTGN